MPQIIIDSANIGTFSFKATMDIYARSVLFDTSASTYQGGGASATLGICFSLIDQDGVQLASIDFTNPQIPNPGITQTYTLDLSNVNFSFLFQTYQIIGAIKESNGTIYQTIPIYKKVCQPVGITDDGYVPGMFQLIPDCVNNVLSVKELTLLVYNSLTPLSITKTGTLSYPTGTISAVNFTNTPFSNNVIYTGSYRINCSTVGQYDLGDDFYVDVTYLTACPFDVTCTDRMGDLMCCIEGVQSTYLKNCENAIGQNAKQLLQDISIPLFIGINKEINGQDASTEASIIKKTLNCDCGIKSIKQNELNPVNPSVYSIVVLGVNGTSVTPSQNGSTKTFTVSSQIYQIVKGNPSDTAFSITIDNSVSGVTKYKLTFDYNQLAINILDAIADNPTLISQLNALITNEGNINLQGLDGSCIIDLSKSDYTITQVVTNSTLVNSIVINGTVYNAPGGLLTTNVSAFSTWLNSLSLGTFSVSVNSLVLLVQTLSNPNSVATISFTNPDLTLQFSSTNATLVQVLQAIIYKICQLNALQVALGQNLTLCTIDYNGGTVQTAYSSTGSQGTFNAGVAAAICNIVARIVTLTGITCSKIQAIFQDNPNGVFGSIDRIYGTLGGNCSAITDLQLGNLFVAAINKYASLKASFCAIDCTVPGTCPDISGINMSIVVGSIGIYGVSYTQTPTASQTATVRYRVHGTTPWIISTNSLLLLPNGNVSSTPPYLISGTTAGTTYDVWINNNCGGTGFIGQITTPTGTVYTGSFLLDNIIYNICGDSPVTLYSNTPFATGIIMYTDIGLTIPITGYTFIAPNSGGTIYQLNTSTGVVGINTGSSCNSGTSGLYILGNDTLSICSGSQITLYTNGAFAVGGTLYNDIALTTPVTGNSYVVNSATNVIYNLNSVTGVIGSSTGISCSGNSSVAVTSNTGNSCNRNITFTITGNPSETVYFNLFFNHDTGGNNGSYSVILNGSGTANLGAYLIGAAHMGTSSGNDSVKITITNTINPSNIAIASLGFSGCPV